MHDKKHYRAEDLYCRKFQIKVCFDIKILIINSINTHEKNNNNPFDSCPSYIWLHYLQ